MDTWQLLANTAGELPRNRALVAAAGGFVCICSVADVAAELPLLRSSLRIASTFSSSLPAICVLVVRKGVSMRTDKASTPGCSKVNSDAEAR